MAYSTAVFVYTQRQIVVLLSGNSVRKFMPVYAKPLTLHKGVDNQIQFQFLNQEQKPVDITGKQITCRVINYLGDEILLSKELTIQYGATGIAALIVRAADIENIDTQKAFYSLEIPVGEFDYPVFVDQNAGARGDMNIVDSVLPSFVPSMPVSIPSGQPFPNVQSNLNPSANTYYTSVISTDGNPTITLQAQYNQFSGNVVIEGSSIGNADWYSIQTHSYANTTDTHGYTVKGFHPYVRISFTSNAGEVANVLVR